MPNSWEQARRRLESASRTLEELRREAGEAPPRPEGEAAAAAGLRAALEQARRALEERSRELEISRVRVRELEREAARPRPEHDPEAAEKLAKAEVELRKAKDAAAAEAAASGGRLTLLQAELVRVESLRRKAEEAAAQADQTRRQVEESLRRELRSVHASLDRAAADAGAREARMQADLQGLQKRLEAALHRADQLAREQRTERERWRAERERLAATLQRASAVHASLRKEAEELRGDRDGRVDELTRRLDDAEAQLAEGRRRPPEPPSEELRSGAPPAPAEAAELVSRLRPAAAAAHERLRELAESPSLPEAERAAARRASSSLSGLADAVALLERYLDDGPAGEPGPLGPALERAAADWSDALARKRCALELSLEPGLPPARRDPGDLRLLLDQLLRRAFESLPPRSLVRLAARRIEGGVEVSLEDDGPGLPARRLKSAFDPGLEPGSLGLGLAFARRALRRWGGDARAERSDAGGLRLILVFPL